MNRFFTTLAVVISFLIASDFIIIHTTDGDSLTLPLSQIDMITFSTFSDTTYMTAGDSLIVPLSQIENITFSTVSDTTPPEGAIEIFPGDDINEIVWNNPEGTAFIIKAGIHRMQEIWPLEGNTFIGEDGAILNGSRLLTEFEQEGHLYYAENQTQGDWYGGSDICQDGWERCNHPEDLFFDNEPLRHVTSLEDVALGKWFFDYDADRIYFFDDPEEHTVETSVTYFAFTNSASSVTIQNLVIEKFASMVMMGAVGSTGGTGWLVEGNEVRLNHGVGVFARSESIVRNNYIHHNGQMGVGTGTEEEFRVTNVLFEANEISYNNYAHVN
ncbi:MAG TPA: hypothetical protein EYO07_08405, partial [Candidatus Marinimicrobia bacterium]|nr:hypothetical protein [Candidatus Neomarinimicrobiota bacterium]